MASLFPAWTNSPTIEEFSYQQKLVLIEGNTLVGIAPIFNSLGSLSDFPGKDDIDHPKGLTRAILNENEPFYKEISEKYPVLGCVIQKESSGNPLSFNPKDIDGRPKFGLVQFDARTFQEWCVEKYKYDDRIWDGKIQYQCAYRMIFEDGQGRRWPSLQKCLDN